MARRGGVDMHAEKKDRFLPQIEGYTKLGTMAVSALESSESYTLCLLCSFEGVSV